MNTNYETFKLRNGAIVLAKSGEFGLFPVNYTNYKQAIKKQTELQASGVNCTIYEVPGNSRCKYIMLNDLNPKFFN
jgi:hypothetical protein